MEDNLYSLLKQSAERNTQRTALEYGKIKLPYSKLILKTDSFAEALKRSGVKHSDNVAVLLKNSPEFIIAAFACFKIGAVLVPVNFYLTAGEIIYILNDARVKVLITSADFESYFYRVMSELRENSNSNADAEMNAKATSEYLVYRKIKNFRQDLYEKIQSAKRMITEEPDGRKDGRQMERR